MASNQGVVNAKDDVPISPKHSLQWKEELCVKNIKKSQRRVPNCVKMSGEQIILFYYNTNVVHCTCCVIVERAHFFTVIRTIQLGFKTMEQFVTVPY